MLFETINSIIQHEGAEKERINNQTKPNKQNKNSQYRSLT